MSEKTFDIAYLSDNLPLPQAEATVEKAGLNHVSMVMSSEDVLEPRVAGFWQGQVKISDDFDDTSEEMIAAFYGED